MKPTEAESKEKTLKKWNEVFPILKKYTSRTLFMRLECLLVGVRLDFGYFPNYALALEVYPLWMPLREAHKDFNHFSGLLCPTASLNLLSVYANNNQFNHYADIGISMFSKILNYDVALGDLTTYILDSSYAKLPILRAPRYETAFMLLFGLASYLDAEDYRRYITNTAYKLARNYESTIREDHGQSVDEYIKYLTEQFSDREMLIRKVKENLSNPKIKSLFEANLILNIQNLPEIQNKPNDNWIKKTIRFISNIFMLKHL